MELLTIEDFDGRRIWERFGRSAARSKNRPFRVSRRARSTALCVALRSAVFARLLGLRLAAGGTGAGGIVLAGAGVPSTGGGRASVWTELAGETGVAGPSAEGDWGAGEAGEAAEIVMAIRVYV